MTRHKPQVFIRLKKRRTVAPGQTLKLVDIAEVLVPDGWESIKWLNIYRVPANEHLVILDVMQVLRVMRRQYPDLHIEAVGPPSDLILEIKQRSRKPPWIAALFVWVLLFIGSGLAIMNFHTDVSMQDVHQRIHYLVTGQEEARPLWIQIPYSLGIGVGMIVFFNHLFKRKLNEEPSPLEVEMHLYQENIDQYVIHQEKEKP